MSEISNELIAIIGTGIALGIFIHRSIKRIDDRLNTVDQSLSARLIAVEKETSRIRGLLEGFGLTGRATLPPPAA